MTLETAAHAITEGQRSLQKLIGQLATETRNGFDQVARQFAETDRRIQELNERTDKRLQETAERMDKFAQQARESSRYYDERVDKLVLAIAELVRRGNPPA
jgi:hypothetical protein